MKRIEPYKNITEAKKSLDNGGRLFNLFSKADDGSITEAEINKAAGITSSTQEMALYLLLASSRMIDEDKYALIGMLSPSVKTAYEKYNPKFLIPNSPSDVSEGVNLMLHGSLKPVSLEDEFGAFTKKLLIAGRVPTYEYESIFKAYKVYQFTDSNSGNSILAVHDKEHQPLEENMYTLGCVSRTYFPKRSDEDQSNRLLEIRFYIL